MKSDKDQWIENVFQSMEGSVKAQPSVDLFAKIKQSIALADDNVIPMPKFRLIAAAASLVLLINVSALLLYVIQKQSGNQASVESVEQNNTYRESLMSTFQIYK